MIKIPILPDWLLKLDDSLPLKFKENIEGAELSEEAAKERLNEWIRSTRTAKKSESADGLKLSIEDFAAIEVVETRQIEKRTVKDYSKPREDPSIESDFSPLEDVWERRPLEGFEATSDEWYRKGSGRVDKCDKCSGEGRLTCLKCQGQGFTIDKCFSCSGSGRKMETCRAAGCNGGWVTQKGSAAEVDFHGRVGGGVGSTTTRVQCRACNGSGKVEAGLCADCHGTGQVKEPCKKCKSTGKIVCDKCEGTGHIVRIQNIQAKATPEVNRLAISGVEGLKDSWLEKPKPIFSTTEESVEGHDFLGKGRSLGGDERLTGEKYEIRLFPVSVATIEGAKQGRDRLYFIGEDRKIEGPALRSFKSIGRIILFRVVPAVIIAGLIIFFGIYAAHHGNDSSPTAQAADVVANPDTETSNASTFYLTVDSAISGFVTGQGEAAVRDIVSQEHPASDIVRIDHDSPTIEKTSIGGRFKVKYLGTIKGSMLGLSHRLLSIQVSGAVTKEPKGWIANLISKKLLSDKKIDDGGDTATSDSNSR